MEKRASKVQRFYAEAIDEVEHLKALKRTKEMIVLEEKVQAINA